MTNTPDTSPEAVERFIPDVIGIKGAWPDMTPHKTGGYVRYADYAALSAELEVERTSHTATLKDAQADHARAEAAEAELAEAVGVLQMIVGGAVYTAADGFSKPHEPEQSRIARAFLARHQKGTSHD